MEHKVKKIPMRQCLGCNEHKPKVELMRVVRTVEGEKEVRQRSIRLPQSFVSEKGKKVKAS